MECRRLGKAGVKVSRICLGAGVRGDLDEAPFVRAIKRAKIWDATLLTVLITTGEASRKPFWGA